MTDLQGAALIVIVFAIVCAVAWAIDVRRANAEVIDRLIEDPWYETYSGDGDW